MAVYSQKRIQDEALRRATMVGTDPHASPVIDGSVVLEDLFYEALRESVMEAASDRGELGTVKRDYTIAVASGVGVLPDTVIGECMDRSNIYVTGGTDDFANSSFQERYNDYLHPANADLLGHYTALGSQFLFREAGGDVAAYTGNVHLVAVGIPAIPTTITDPITIGTDTAERTIAILAAKLRGGQQQPQ